MSQVINPTIVPTQTMDFSHPASLKQLIFIALSTLLTLGLILSYFLGAPWFVTASFFCLALFPLFPVWKVVDNQRSRIIE